MKNIFNEIGDLKNEPATVVPELYDVSLKSLPIAMLLAILSTIFLYEQLGMLIVIWCIVVLLIIAYRLYNTYLFFKHRDRDTLTRWYQKFVFSALLTAIIFGLFSILFIPHLEPFGQMFSVAVVLGMSFGASTSLHLNYRLALVYMSIIVIPAIVTLFIFSESVMFYIIPVLLILYFMAQLMFITTLHEQ